MLYFLVAWAYFAIRVREDSYEPYHFTYEETWGFSIMLGLFFAITWPYLLYKEYTGPNRAIRIAFMG